MTGRSDNHMAHRNRAGKQQGVPSMTARQLEAYLLSKDTLRRIQRSAALLSEARSARPHKCSC